jgi:urease accessory protein UreF
MSQQPQILSAAELRGDIDPLLQRIGSAEGLAALAETCGAFIPRQIASTTDLRAFLEGYHARLLQPLELPAIQRAYHHASRNEARELIALDQQLAAEPLLKHFAAPSRLIGRGQLERLRPLQDLRFAQRYLAAVERGEASGWHTLVYGLTLAVYSLPLRQGLLAYATQTTRGFIHAASRSFPITDAAADDLLAEISAHFPAAVEPLLASHTIG